MSFVLADTENERVQLCLLPSGIGEEVSECEFQGKYRCCFSFHY